MPPLPANKNTTNRYTNAALGYQLATLLSAGITPAILASLYKDPGQSIIPLVVFLSVMALVSIVLILLTRESKNNDHTSVR
ncbi:hypothetical protein [Arthrobacter sp. ZGTC412]|uniref:hypothetical protein n=1 Tax=Arthrobacter sp. ZGTC412 TaxID=2058900 RepID=UPI0035A072AE